MGRQPVSRPHRLSLLAAVWLLSGCDQAMRTGALPPGIALGFDRQPEAASPIDTAGGPSVTPPGLDGTTPGIPDARPTQTPGGGPGGPVVPATFTVEVRDEGEQPLADATVVLADGQEVVTDAEGRVTLPGAFPAGVAVVSKPGYATSLVAGLDSSVPLHLRRADGTLEPFTPQRRDITASVRWPGADHLGGVAYLIDSLDSAGDTVPLAGDGFTMPVTSRRVGDPTAVLMVVATDSQNRLLVGVSRPFKTFTGEPGTIDVHVADRAIDYAIAGRPAGLDTVRSRLEVHQDGAPAVVIDGVKDSGTGRFQAPGDGRLPGRLRLVVEAHDTDYTATSQISLVPTAGQVATGTFLTPPTATLNRASGELSWPAVPGATGYRAEVRNETFRLAPTWEAWLGPLTMATLPTAFLRSSETGQVTIEAVDDPSLTSRRIASLGPRALRLAPWEQSPVYRLASRRLPPS